jgi:hypothetical protein
MGTIREQWQKLPDLSPALRTPIMLLVAALLCIGFFPQLFVRSVAPTFGTRLSANADTQMCSHGAVSPRFRQQDCPSASTQRGGYNVEQIALR